MLNIITCIKVVTDPEAPTSTFKIDPEGQRVIPGQGVPPVLNPYDENCLEAALRLKDEQPARITVISLGKNIPKAVIKKSLAVGADDLILVEDEGLEEADGYTTASLLAEAIKKKGGFDLILTGRMAADTNAGQVGPGIAEFLNIPVITVARKIEVNEGLARIEQVLADGCKIIEATLPCVVTVSHEIGEMRSATVKGLMAAQKQPFTVWQTNDLNADVASKARKKRQKLFIPETHVECQMVTGETPEESGEKLAEEVINLTHI
ncbi:MAG TPA: electron transfer flavoprotein subunit beta/FixA family protein [Dehalococcoidia bacterium]|nr:electron transfer flavoprotein subunit beta/FixA family protein [Dehalococcoidia bacterium]